ncbi:hypothetical protein IAU60_001643 [Kwoniella sp. DSM 27419]
MSGPEQGEAPYAEGKEGKAVPLGNELGLSDVELNGKGEQRGDAKDGDHGSSEASAPHGLEQAGAEPSTPERKSRSKPSPLTLTTDLLDPHPADSLHPPDSPTTSLISSLRAQLSLLSDQSVALNQKLIASISRSADLEDELHELQGQHTTLGEKAKELEGEKNRWEESMNTGLLVERSQIKDEMQRLAAGLVEEERRRGSAEERREQVESEVDDLTAKLFDQANTMVVAERMSRAKAEARLKSTEENLAAAEAAVRDMQLHLQSLPVGGTQIAAPANQVAPVPTRKYLSSHVPYGEFSAFLTHLRSLRPIKESSKNTFPPPLVTNLLTQPFLARAMNDDHEPTLRLDAAPDLSWLSRRSVSQAIISGDLIIEPVSSTTLLAQSGTAMHDIGCSLCGKPIFAQLVPQSPATSHFGPPPMHPHRGSNPSSSSRFSLKPFFNSSTSVTGSPSAPGPPSPGASPMTSPAIGTSGQNPSIYVFRIAKPQTATGQTDKSDSKLYPLCKTGWCLERLRATCALWHFVRTGIVHVVWHGDDGTLTTSESASGQTKRDSTVSISIADTPIPIIGTVEDTSTALEAESATAVAGEITAPESKNEAPPLPTRKKSGWALGFKLSDKSGGSWTRGWKSGSTNSPPVSPGGHRDSVGSLGAEKEGSAHEGLGLGAPLDISEKNSAVPHSAEATEDADGSPDGKPADESKQEGINGEATEQTGSTGLEAPNLSRAGSSSSIPLSTTTDEVTFSTPKGEGNDLPPDDNESSQVHGVDGTPRSDPTVATEASAPQSGPGDNAVELASPKLADSGAASPTVPPSPGGTRAPPPIPRRAAARNRLSQLNNASPTTENAKGEIGSGSESPAPVSSEADGGGSEIDLSALRELADELDGSAASPAEHSVTDLNGETNRADGGTGEAVEAAHGEQVVSIPEHGSDAIGDEHITNSQDLATPAADAPTPDKEEPGESAPADEEPFTPVNLDEKFPPSPAFPPPPSRSRPTSLTPAPPPPLPARHPKTPVMGSNASSSGPLAPEGEKRFLGEEDKWEEKTWKSVVRLKEEMWRTRVGVVDRD